MATQGYTTKDVAKPESLEHRVFFYHEGKLISPFHDIPLWADKTQHVAHMVVEIPMGTKAKLEISKDNYMNPIKQDVKNGKLRYVHWEYPFNYGALPQTWENPAFIHPDTKAKGDNDPVDVVDLSTKVSVTGAVKKVKVLGTYAMVDEGETDWKVVVIDLDDPLASKLNDIKDIEAHMPGKLKQVFEFLRDYKIPDGKPANHFAFDGELKDKKFALDVIDECYEEWEKLVHDPNPKIQNANTTQQKTPHFTDSKEAEKKAGLV
jgi:inorganic pyrophosphatase